MTSWPPALSELKGDMNIGPSDTRDDVALQVQLDAAVSFVERVRPAFNYRADPLSTLPAPVPDLNLGTVRLAGRWYTRRKSPDALVAMGDLGSARIPSFDPDIERLLGIGRFKGATFA
jgi:hypothetical protein